MHELLKRLARWALAAALLVGAASPAAATCEQVGQLLARGLSITQVAVALGAPIDAVQACLIPDRGIAGAPGPPPLGAAGPPPLGAAGPSPFGAAGPPPLGAGGPAPLGAAGPPPLGAAGPPPIGSSPHKTR
jgi:hypothetical protein